MIFVSADIVAHDSRRAVCNPKSQSGGLDGCVKIYSKLYYIAGICPMIIVDAWRAVKKEELRRGFWVYNQRSGVTR